MEKVKVLQVFNQFNQGGIEHVVLNWMKNNPYSNVEFHFAIISGKKGVLDNYAVKLGGIIHYFDDESSFKTNLERIITEFGPFDVVHSHVYFFSGYVLKIADKMGVPIRIAHAHDTFKGEKRNLIRFMYESIMKHEINKYATYKFGVSSDSCEHVYGKWDDHTFIVNNGINLEEYTFNEDIRKKEREALSIHKTDKVIINIGRFEDQKDHDFLINVFKELVSTDKRFRLILVGSGSLKKKIVDKVKQLNIGEYVIFLENRNDVPALLMASDVMVMPSKYEGLPIVLVEAQATGLPCVISGNITQEVILQKNVKVLSKSNDTSWVEAIKNLNLKRIGGSSENLKEKGFDIENITEFVMKKYGVKE